MLNMLAFTANYQPQPSVAAEGGLIVFLLIYLLLILLTMIGMWKMFSKAGIPGILAIIPIVNIFFFPKVGGKPGWWGLLLLIPLVSIVFAIIINIGIAQRFGRGVGTILGLIFLAPIFICILGFGSAQWTPPPTEA